MDGGIGPLLRRPCPLSSPGVGQDADGPAEHEQPARERRGEAQLGVDDGGRPVDVHGHRGDQPLDLERGPQVRARHHPVLGRLRHQAEQRVAARVAAVEAVPESGQVTVTRPPARDHGSGVPARATAGITADRISADVARVAAGVPAAARIAAGVAARAA
ncbi:hypothetical protein GCM10020220_087320 [Nonomuraea rubra]